MIAIDPKTIDFSRSTPATAVGIDNGHGLLKLAIGADSSQMKVRCPSKFKEVREELSDYPTSRYGSTFYYRDGDAKTLIGTEWKTGELAYNADPHGHTKLSDKPEYKIEYALHSILGALGTLPYRQVWNLYLVASIHNSKLFAKQLTEAIEGTHIVCFNGRHSSHSTIKLHVGLIAPEGAGSYIYCRHQNLIDHTKYAIALDFGTGTIIWNVFAANGAIERREVLGVGGCIDLLDALARDRELQIYEGGKLGDVELIRQGIESRSFLYGNSGINFRDAYQRELMPWLKDRFSLGLKAVADWRKLAGSFVVWGGGAQLPGVAAAVQKFGYIAVADGSWANAIGLQRLAQSRLERSK
jgi:hypothetical protein